MSSEVFADTILNQLKFHAKAYNKSKISLKAMKAGVFHSYFHYYPILKNDDYVKRLLTKVYEDGADLYQVINQTAFKAVSYTQDEICIGRSRTVCFDIDKIPDIKDKECVISMLKAAGLLPTSHIFTRNGVQLFYFTGKNYLRTSEYKALNDGFQLILNDLFKSKGYTCDSSVCNIAGLMRVPGSLHHKQEPFQISEAVFNSDAFIFNPKVVRDMVARFYKDHGLVSERVHLRRVVNQGGNSINPVHYKECKTVEDVLKVIDTRKSIRNESMSCRHIAAILNENGIKISKSTVQRKLVLMQKDNVLLKVKDAVWCSWDLSKCRGAEYVLNYKPEVTEEKYLAADKEIKKQKEKNPYDTLELLPLIANKRHISNQIKINKIIEENIFKIFKEAPCILKI